VRSFGTALAYMMTPAMAIKIKVKVLSFEARRSILSCEPALSQTMVSAAKNSQTTKFDLSGLQNFI